jgi:hypothetical protein
LPTRQQTEQRDSLSLSGVFLVQGGCSLIILVVVSLPCIESSIIMRDKNNGDKGGKNPDKPNFAYVSLSYSPDADDEEMYAAYHDSLSELAERERIAEEDRTLQQMEKRMGQKDKEFHAGLTRAVDSMTFKTPSPDSRAGSAFKPLTQPPRPPPPPPHMMHPIYGGTTTVNSGGRDSVGPSQMNLLINPYGYLSDHYRDGRRSAPPMLPSPPSGQRHNMVPTVTAAKLPPKPTGKNNSDTVTKHGGWTKKNSGGGGKKKSKGAGGGTQGLGGGSMHYKEDELNDLMDLMEEIQPIGKFEKEQVAQKYNVMHPDRPREYQNLMSQFNKFATKKPPTGDPDCPPLVRRAKQITKLIRDKAGLCAMVDDNEEDADDDDSLNDCLVDNAKKKRKEKKDKNATADREDDDPESAQTGSRPIKKSRKEDTNKTLMEMFMFNEMAAVKREAAAEKRRHDERQQMLQLGIGVLHSFASVFTGKPIPVDRSLLPQVGPSTVAPEGRKATSDDDDSSSSGSEKTFDIRNYKFSKKKTSFNDQLAELKQKKNMKKSKGKSPTDAVAIMLLDSMEDEDEDKNKEGPSTSSDNDNDDDGGCKQGVI